MSVNYMRTSQFPRVTTPGFQGRRLQTGHGEATALHIHFRSLGSFPGLAPRGDHGNIGQAKALPWNQNPGQVSALLLYFHCNWKIFGSLYIWSHFKLLTCKAK